MLLTVLKMKVFLTPRLDKNFVRQFLAVGGKDTALDAFINFRGREPKIDALLRHQGWTNS
jgi:oligopeptidase A